MQSYTTQISFDLNAPPNDHAKNLLFLISTDVLDPLTFRSTDFGITSVRQCEYQWIVYRPKKSHLII